MMDTETKVYERIVKVAKNKDIITYGKVASCAGMDTNLGGWNWEIRNILDAISRREHRNGRPLLSAVVVNKDTVMPGAGFFKLAKELGRYNASDDLECWSKELQRVHDYWAKR